MMFSLLSQFNSAAIAILLFLAMLGFFACGRKLVSLRQGKESGGFGPVEGSLLGLLALLLSFTFSMSAGRFEARRQVLVQEANDISTAALRADLYPEEERRQFRADFKEYVEARIAFFEAGMDPERVAQTSHLSSEISGRIWQRAARLGQDRSNLIPSNQMIPALNEMIDVVTTRTAARQATVPDAILWMLFGLCLTGSLIVGYGSAKVPWIVGFTFAFMISACVFLIVDLDRPSQGFITLGSTNQHIVDLREIFSKDE